MMRHFPGMTRRVLFGVDRLCAEPRRAGIGLQSLRRVGLLTNDAANLADSAETSSRAALLRAGAPLVRLFSTEHGIGRAAPDGVAVPHTVDPVTGLPVYSVYGGRLAPPDELLADLELLLVDLPDIGTRWYTYVWSVTHAIDACARAGTAVAVLDRPNPLGGLLDLCEGPELDESCCASFLGRMRMPVRHSLTLGELAVEWQRRHAPDCDIRVLRCEGWSREMMWADTGLPFVPTSPAISSFESALLYPGIALFEGSNVNVGRGSDQAFQQISAPWLEVSDVAHHRLVRAFSDGVEVVTGRTRLPIGGDSPSLSLHVVEPRTFRPVALGLALLSAVRELHPVSFRWTDYPTVVNPAGTGHFERLAGRRDIRPAIDGPSPVAAKQIIDWCDAGDWSGRVGLLYE
ncbi:MAG: exo-beta-N-acetylmuramidase NamZ family protein [Gemmatimonadota bacterium]